MPNDTTTPKGRHVHAERSFHVEREGLADDGGRFRAVLATSGEASDGHILSIDGMRIDGSIPMLFRHDSTPQIPTLGRIEEPMKSRDGNLEVLRVTGRFDLEGEAGDPLLAIRKGFASLVRSGALDAMSVRWDPIPGKFVPRASLPDGHPAKAERGTPGPAASGMFFEQSIAKEGSIVAIGADPGALVGRARASTSAFEEAFWSVLAGQIGAREEPGDVKIEEADFLAAVREAVLVEVRDSFRNQFDELREQFAMEAESESPAIEESREAPIETVRVAAPRSIAADELRKLLRETASDSAARRIAHALGRIR